MSKLLAITALLVLLVVGAESFRVPRETDEEQGTLSRITDSFRSYYSRAVNAASAYLEGIKGLKFEEKAKNLYSDTKTVVRTYAEIVQDQLYHALYAQQ
ncbi:apolipoprotein C-II [Takifugu flavidus]|uniref:apolipoprotein C-II n=1 Tax=Takifugu flavidus TaxID=433684 RepID=UPI002544A1D6|nr:apolipoprotein C-II [Takifugu flavidus]